MHVHHEVVGINKGNIKAEIRQLKKERDAAIKEKKKDDIQRIRRKIHRLKKTLRKAAV
jgi:hypothetical protein